VYPKEDQVPLAWDCDPKTYAHRVAFVIDCLDFALPYPSFAERLLWPPWTSVDPAGRLSFVYVVLDGKFCPIELDLANFQLNREFYSPKHGACGLKYELGVHWKTGNIVWFAGGVWGPVHDLTLAVLPTGTLALINYPAGEHIFADKAYLAAQFPQFLTPFKGRSANLSVLERQWNNFLNPVRVIVENALGRLCKFTILQHPFRGGMTIADRITQHRQIFRVIVRIARIDIALHPLRRDDFEHRHHRYAEPDDE
jgi:hypothetical protein